MADFSPSSLVKKKEENSDEMRPHPSNHDSGHSAAHPGFKAVEKKIGQKSGIRNPGAVLAAASRGASPAAKRANPRLKRVKG